MVAASHDEKIDPCTKKTSSYLILQCVGSIAMPNGNRLFPGWSMIFWVLEILTSELSS